MDEKTLRFGWTTANPSPVVQKLVKATMGSSAVERQSVLVAVDCCDKWALQAKLWQKADSKTMWWTL